MLASASSAANALWLTEWLAEALELRPGLRVLDDRQDDQSPFVDLRPLMEALRLTRARGEPLVAFGAVVQQPSCAVFVACMLSYGID